MNFKQAMYLLSINRKVRRVSWTEECGWLENGIFQNQLTVFWKVPQDSKTIVGGIYVTWSPMREDYWAKDWEEYKDDDQKYREVQEQLKYEDENN